MLYDIVTVLSAVFWPVCDIKPDTCGFGDSKGFPHVTEAHLKEIHELK